MIISAIDQEVSDFDWFARDSEGYLVHFVSCGNRLPDSVADSYERLALLETYFSALPILFTKAEISPDLDTTLVLDSNCYLKYACRGLFSYKGSQWPNSSYELIASPAQAVKLTDLPPAIAKLVSRTKLNFSVLGLASLSTATVA